MNKQDSAPKCPKCGHEMMSSKVVRAWRRKIPFIDAEIQIVHWVDEWFCPYCTAEEESKRMYQILARSEDFSYRVSRRHRGKRAIKEES